MSIASELQNYADGLDDAWDAAEDMGATIPHDRNMVNLDDAIRTIPVSSPNDGVLTITQNGTTIQTFSADQATNVTAALTDTTYTAGTGINISAQNVISATGSTITTFHWGGSPNYSMYKDSGYTTAATYSDIATAFAAGLVYIADGEDEVTYVMVSDIPDAYTITVTGIGLPDHEGGSASYAYASSTWTKTATEFQKKLTAGTNVQINGTTISATDTTYSDFTGATSLVAGTAGLVPAPTTSDPDKFLKGDGTWATPTDTTYTAGTNVSISAQNVISATDTTYSNFTGATSSVAGAAGLVPAPAAGDEGKALHGDGTWKDTTAKLVEMSYGESNAWAKFIAAYNAGSIVYCRASSNSNPGSGSQTRKAFMAYVNNATSPTSVEFQYVRSVSSKTDSQQGDQVFVYTLTNASGGTWSVASRNMSPKINVSGPITKTFSNGANATVTIGADAMTGATSSADGAAGIVPKPVTGDQDKVLTGAGAWAKVGNGNIDWSTMEHWSITLSGNQTVSQTTAYDYVDIPDASVTFTATVGGVYLVLLNASVMCAGGSTDCYAKALLNGGNLAVGVGQNPAASKFTSVSSAQVFTATQASNTIKMQLGGGIANANYTILGSVQSSVQIMRIA